MRKFKLVFALYQLLFLIFFPILAHSQSVPEKITNRFKRTVPSFGMEVDPEQDKKLEDEQPLKDANIDSFASFYNIHVLGEVARPGTYRILPSDRATDAMKYAGGVTPRGSLRRVELRRGGSRRIMDIYRYRYNGDLSENLYLMENDVIFIPLKKAEFKIEGPINRPGSYEMIGQTSLRQAVELAGGFSAGLSHKEPIRVIRFDEEEKKQIIKVENESLSQFKIQKGDIIVVPHFLISDKKFDYNVGRIPGDNIFYPTINDSVYVVGAVATAGPYTFQPTFKVKDYVSQAGPSNLASLGRLKIITADGKRKGVSKMTNVNAGDTIVVPEKAMTAMNFVTWFGALTSMALTTFVFVDRFAQ